MVQNALKAQVDPFAQLQNPNLENKHPYFDG
jgi:hypothetical protein